MKQRKSGREDDRPTEDDIAKKSLESRVFRASRLSRRWRTNRNFKSQNTLILVTRHSPFEDFGHGRGSLEADESISF
jgi:hypothetical protein